MSDIDFSALVPPRLKINGLPDGSTLELMRRAEMGGSDYAAVLEIQSRVEQLDKKTKGAGNQTARAALMSKLEEEMTAFIKLVSSNATDEMLSGVKFGTKMAIIRWYHEQEAAPGPNGSGDQTKES